MFRDSRIIGFALVSAIGLLLDFATFSALIGLRVPIFTANMCAGAFAVTFVYFASVRRVFAYEGRFLFGLLAIYILYQICGVSLASMAVNFLTGPHLPAIAAKVAILPLTFSANYLFMSFLTRQKRLIVQ